MKAIRIAVVGFVLLAGSQSARAVCVGDCNGNNVVAVNELVVGVNILLEVSPLDACPVFDANSSGTVQVNELVAAVNNLLRECPPIDSTATPTTDILIDTPTPTTSVPVSTPTPTLPPPTITFQTCDFSGAGDALAIYLTDTTLFQTVQPDGEMGVGCVEGTGAGGAATRQCSCEFRRFDPLQLIGLGFVCIDEGTDSTGAPVQCPIGKQACDQGDALKITLRADHQIGSCTGNADCASQCDAYCGALNPPHTRFIGACERFCQGGERADQPCDCDVVGATTCPDDGSGLLGCPLGSCEGRDGDGEADTDCHCQCVNEAAPGPSDAGAFQCRLAVSIRVEANQPCDQADVLVRLPAQCAPLTSDQHTGLVVNTNEDPIAEIAPDALTGASVSCSAFDTSPAGMKLVTNLAFYDSTVGDLVSQLSLTCQ